MTPDALAALHALCFVDTPRPWTAAEFGQFLAEPSTLLLPGPHGFAIARCIGPEAELLTLAVHPDHRRHGTARTLLNQLDAAARDRGAHEIFLEVAETNLAARALYGAAGYRLMGRRPGYYARRGQSLIAALIMAKGLVAQAPEIVAGLGKTN